MRSGKSFFAGRGAVWAQRALGVAVILSVSRCAAPKDNLPSVSPDWRLVPEATVVGQRRQFFAYGRRLDSVEITVPASVTLEKGQAKSDGRVLSLYLTVRGIKGDSAGPGEKKGVREISVKTPDTTAVFELQVLDEAHPR